MEKKRKKAEDWSWKQILDIKAIEFDWIFNQSQGSKFLKALADCEDIEIYSNNLIKLIITFLWSYF